MVTTAFCGKNSTEHEIQNDEVLFKALPSYETEIAGELHNNQRDPNLIISPRSAPSSPRNESFPSINHEANKYKRSYQRTRNDSFSTADSYSNVKPIRNNHEGTSNCKTIKEYQSQPHGSSEVLEQRYQRQCYKEERRNRQHCDNDRQRYNAGRYRGVGNTRFNQREYQRQRIQYDEMVLPISAYQNIRMTPNDEYNYYQQQLPFIRKNLYLNILAAADCNKYLDSTSSIAESAGSEFLFDGTPSFEQRFCFCEFVVNPVTAFDCQVIQSRFWSLDYQPAVDRTSQECSTSMLNVWRMSNGKQFELIEPYSMTDQLRDLIYGPFFNMEYWDNCNSRISTMKLYFGEFLSLSKSPTSINHSQDSLVNSFKWWNFPFHSYNGSFYDVIITEQGKLIWVNWELGHVVYYPPSRTVQFQETKEEESYKEQRANERGPAQEFYDQGNTKELVIVVEEANWGLCISENGHYMRYGNSKSGCQYHHYNEQSLDGTILEYEWSHKHYTSWGMNSAECICQRLLSEVKGEIVVRLVMLFSFNLISKQLMNAACEIIGQTNLNTLLLSSDHQMNKKQEKHGSNNEAREDIRKFHSLEELRSTSLQLNAFVLMGDWLRRFIKLWNEKNLGEKRQMHKEVASSASSLMRSIPPPVVDGCLLHSESQNHKCGLVFDNRMVDGKTPELKEIIEKQIRQFLFALVFSAGVSGTPLYRRSSKENYSSAHRTINAISNDAEFSVTRCRKNQLPPAMQLSSSFGDCRILERKMVFEKSNGKFATARPVRDYGNEKLRWLNSAPSWMDRRFVIAGSTLCLRPVY